MYLFNKIVKENCYNMKTEVECMQEKSLQHSLCLAIELNRT